MNTSLLLQKALQFEFLSIEEGVFLFKNASLAELMAVADQLRKIQVPHGKVTWIIDRNVNTTNVCIANCKFCNFYRIPGHKEAYITDIETYKRKIDKTFLYGGEQLLLQGGHHPELGLSYYVNLFKELKKLYPALKLREVQAKKPEGAKGFLAFIPWTFQDVDTLLTKIRGVQNLTTPEEYIRMIAMSRIMLPNVKNIQASWLTVGKEVAQLCLHAGANDFGSIMIEENVVSAAGAPHRFTSKGIQEAIREAGFEPQLRNQQYEFRKIPEHIEEQVIDY